MLSRFFPETEVEEIELIFVIKTGLVNIFEILVLGNCKLNSMGT